jgi:hypothetical protein
MPPAPCAIGSTITAASSSRCVAIRRASSATSDGSHASSKRQRGRGAKSCFGRTPSNSDEEVHLFLATGLAAKPVHHESFEAIEIHWVTLDEALRRALTGEIRDSKTLAGLVRANAIRHEGGDVHKSRR